MNYKILKQTLKSTEVLNDFSLNIIANGSYVKRLDKNDNIYFAMPHKTYYKIELGNYKDVKCDAKVYIDGEHIGTWRINSFSKIAIERPDKIDRKFVFLEEDTKLAIKSGIESGLHENGLIKVEFIPEKVMCDKGYNDEYSEELDKCECKNKDKRSQKKSMSAEFSMNSYSSGATALGKHSDQTFDSVSAITSIDEANRTIITVRLIAEKPKVYKPIISLRGALRATATPPRIEFTDHWSVPDSILWHTDVSGTGIY